MKDSNGNIIYCQYGCNQEANFILKNGKYCCCDHYCKCINVKNKIGSKISESINRKIQNGTFVCSLENYNKTRPRLYPKRIPKYHSVSHPAWNKGLTKETSTKVLQIANTIKQKILDGTLSYKNRKLSQSAKEKISKYQSEKLETHENGFFHVKYYTIKNLNNIEYKVRGKWELNVAEILNQNHILWERPKGLAYKYDYLRHYIPDFYLPKTNEYIEVKGYYSKWDHTKLSCILDQYPNIRIYFLNEKNYNLFTKNKIMLNDSMLLTKQDCIV